MKNVLCLDAMPDRIESAIRALLEDERSIADDSSGKSCWVTTAPTPPFLIKVASAGWHRLWGFSEADVSGESTAILNDLGHDAHASLEAGKFISLNRTFRCRNVTKNG